MPLFRVTTKLAAVLKVKLPKTSVEQQNVEHEAMLNDAPMSVIGMNSAVELVRNLSPNSSAEPDCR